MTIEHRRAALEKAGHNVLNLEEADVEFDLLTDVPPRAVLDTIREAGVQAARGKTHVPPLEPLAQQLYGEAHYVFTTKGRAAEDALAAVFARDEGVVVSNGLFLTTALAFKRRGMEVETGSRLVDGRSDIDLIWLENRLVRGGVDIVCLEPCNNQLAGWPLSMDNVIAVQKLCRRYDMRLLIDGTRIFANSAADRSPLAQAREVLALADAFTISCTKELMVPNGALVAVREPTLRARLFAHIFEMGTLLEPVEATARLARALQYLFDNPSPISARRHQLERLANVLRKEGIPIVEPVGGHAVYVDIGGLLAGEASTHVRSLEALIYERHGLRCMIAPYPLLNKMLLRLPLSVERYSDQELDAIGEAVRDLFRHAREAPLLLPVSDSNDLHPLLSRFSRADFENSHSNLAGVA